MLEHLLVFPDRDTAEAVADELVEAGYAEVRVVREALAGEQDDEDHEWAVYVADARQHDLAGESAERLHLADLAHELGGWYDPHPR